MKDIVFKRRLSKSMDNKASIITIPRAIAQSWEQYATVNLVFNGDSLVITPFDERGLILPQIKEGATTENDDGGEFNEVNEEQYLQTLEKIKVLLLNVTKDFEPGDDDVTHFFEKLYALLDEVIAI